MATLKNTIKKAEKLSGQKIQTNSNNQHWVEYRGYSISFYPNGRATEDFPEVEATNFYTTNKPRTEDDRNSDYFPGTFHDNLSQAFRFIDRKFL